MAVPLRTLVPAPVELPPRAVRLRADIRAFLAKERSADRWQPSVDGWFAGWDERFSRKVAAQGWLGMTLPRRYGGQDASVLERYVVIEELVAAGAPVAAHWVADQQVGPALLRFGTEAQRQEFLPGIAEGRTYFGIAVSEPHAGSDAAAISTEAHPVEGGWVLSGTKAWVAGAGRVHALVVLARSAAPDAADRRHGMTQFIVRADVPGLTIRPRPVLTGEPHLAEVSFDGVFVPAAMVLGKVGRGWSQLMGQLAFERSGPEQFLSTYPLLRELAGVPASGREVEVARLLGSALARLWTLRQMSLGVAGELGDGRAPELAASLVKELGSRFGHEVVEVARMVRGGSPAVGSADDYRRLLAEAVLAAPSFTLRGGSNEVLRGIVARGLGSR